MMPSPICHVSHLVWRQSTLTSPDLKPSGTKGWFPLPISKGRLTRHRLEFRQGVPTFLASRKGGAGPRVGFVKPAAHRSAPRSDYQRARRGSRNDVDDHYTPTSTPGELEMSDIYYFEERLIDGQQYRTGVR